jgi:hypothetical protein
MQQWFDGKENTTLKFRFYSLFFPHMATAPDSETRALGRKYSKMRVQDQAELLADSQRSDAAFQCFENWKKTSDMFQPSREALRQQAEESLHQQPASDTRYRGTEEDLHASMDSAVLLGDERSLDALVPKRKPGSDWVHPLQFRYLTAGDNSRRTQLYQRAERHVVELADEFNLETYPKRILLARQKRKGPGAATHDKQGQPLSPYNYDFLLYPNIGSFLSEFHRTTQNEHTHYACVEEDQVCYLYIDFELPFKNRELAVHGTGMLALLGYSLSMVRALLAQVLGVQQLAAWGDSFLVYDASVPNDKWSAHVHVAWPFVNIAALREAMEKVADRLKEMDKLDLPCVKPLFYSREMKASRVAMKTNTNSTPTTERWCAVDLRVWTKLRNFRLPRNQKVDKRNWLYELDIWKRPLLQGGPLLTDMHHHLSAGMILARNSYSIFSLQSIKDPEVGRRLPEMQWQERVELPVHTGRDFFRCLPMSGQMHELRKWMQPLFAVGSGTFSGKPGDAFIRYVQVVYDSDWQEWIGRHAEPQCKQLFAVCSQSPHSLGTALLLLGEWLVPGLPLEKQYQHDSKGKGADMLTDIASVTRTIEAKRHSDPLLCFRIWWQVVLRAEKYHTQQADEAQRSRKAVEAQALYDDFHAVLLRDLLEQSAYNRTILANSLFLSKLAHMLLLCSDLHCYEFTSPEASLPRVALDTMPLDVRKRVYRYAFESSMGPQQYPAVRYDALVTAPQAIRGMRAQELADAVIFGAISAQ